MGGFFSFSLGRRMDEAEHRLHVLFQPQRTGCRIVRREDPDHDDMRKFFIWNLPVFSRDVLDLVENALPGAVARVFVTGEFGPGAIVLEVDLSPQRHYTGFATALGVGVVLAAWGMYALLFLSAGSAA